MNYLECLLMAIYCLYILNIAYYFIKASLENQTILYLEDLPLKINDKTILMEIYKQNLMIKDIH
jgi:hypothetical protein